MKDEPKETSSTEIQKRNHYIIRCRFTDDGPHLDGYYIKSVEVEEAVHSHVKLLEERIQELKALQKGFKRVEAALVRIAKAHGIDSPIVLMAMSATAEENYAEILARYVEEKMKPQKE